MSLGAIRAGRAFLEIGARDNLTKGLNLAQAKLKSFGKGVRTMGVALTTASAAAGASLFKIVTGFADFGDKLVDMRDRTGIAVSSLFALGTAAERGGASMEDLESGIKNMLRLLHEAGEGSKAAVDSLRALGLSIDMLAKLPPDKAFLKIAEALSHVKNQASKTSLAMQIFGKSGTRLLPLFVLGSAGIKAMTAHLDELGIAFGDDAAEKAAVFNDAMDDMRGVVRAVSFGIGAALAPTVKDLIDRFRAAAIETLKWIKNNEELIVSLGKTVALAGAAGVAIFVLGTVMGALSRSIGLLLGLGGLLRMVWTAIAAVLSILPAAVGLVTSAFGFLTTPIGLVIGAVVAAVAAMVYFSGAVQTAADGFSKAWGEIAAVFDETFAGISDALAGGQLGLAAKIAWAGIQAAFFEFVQPIREGWLKFTRFFEDVWNEVVHNVQKIWNTIVNGIAAGVLTILEQFGILEKGAAKAIDNAWKKEQKAIDRSRENRRKEIEGDADDSLAKIRARTDAARAELTALRQQAAVAKEKKLVDDANKKPPEIPPPPDIPPIVARIQQAATGTFSAALASRLGASSLEEEAQRANIKAADNIEALFKHIKRNQVMLTFR